MSDTSHASTAPLGEKMVIRKVTQGDLDHIAALDERVTAHAKPEYWLDIYERYATRRTNQRFFLVAEPKVPSAEFPLLGFIVGEVRGWEFGSEPCGWIFAFSVEPDTRQQGIGEHLFEAISQAFRSAGVKTMRTMVPRQNRLHMAFFRSEGMVAGPYIQLEKELDD